MTHHTRTLLCLAAFSALLCFNPHPASARFCGNDPVNNVDPLGLEEKNPDDFMEKMVRGLETRNVSGSTIDLEEVKEGSATAMEIGRSVPESIITTMLMGGMGSGVKVVERPMVNSGAGQAIGSFLTRISRSARITGRRVVRFFSRDKTLLAEETVSVAGGGRTGANLARATKEVAREAERSAAETTRSKLFRGGSSLEARLGVDVKQGADGLIHPLTKSGKPQGLSVNIDPKDPFIQKYGGAFPVEQIPEGLQVLEVGRPGHFVVAPKVPMTFEKFSELLKQVKLGTSNSIQ